MRFHSLPLTLALCALGSAACGGDPHCPTGSSWDTAAHRCLCNEGLLRNAETHRCIPPGEWLDGAIDPYADAGPRDDASFDDPDGGALEPIDDGGMPDGSVDDGSVDDGSVDDGSVDDGSAPDAGDACDECAAPPAHGAARCDEGACGVACDPGFGAVTIAEGDLRCSAFGGAYVRRTNGTCLDANPLTGGCNCGELGTLELRWRVDRENPHTHAMLGLCEPGSTPDGGSFGGTYVVEEEPSRRCLEPNGETGECGCPEGFAPSHSWIGRNDIDRRTRVVFCLAATPEPGAAIVAAYTELRCEGATSCASGEICTCPTGTSAIEIASGLQRAGTGECETRSVICAAE